MDKNSSAIASDKKHCDDNDNKSWVQLDNEGHEHDDSHILIDADKDKPELRKEKSNRNSAPLKSGLELDTSK